MAKRLTEEQKKEIIQSFKEGITIDVLSHNFECSKLTITRNVKKSLGESKYKKIINEGKSINKKTSSEKKVKDNIFQNNLNTKVIEKDFIDTQNSTDRNNETNFFPDSSFLEITPLVDYKIEDSSRKELSSMPISEIKFPKLVYLIVDNKIELEIKILKDFPEWQFLPQNDLDRRVIVIYSDLKLAKRHCSKDKKVIKVPNTDVFRLVAPILVERGISRIVSSESLIAL